MIPNLNSALSAIYGGIDSEQAISKQVSRYTFALDLFERHFGSTEELRIFRAPGRVNLIGEHTDYNHGYVLPAALDKDFVLLATPRNDGQVNLINIESRFSGVRFEISKQIPIGEAGDWGNYARGAAQMVAQAIDSPFNGFDGLVVGAAPYGVPVGSGLSSSSALTVVMIVALAHFAEWRGEKVDLVQMSSDAEWYVGTRGGIMDQFAALLSQKDHALFLDCRPMSPSLAAREEAPNTTYQTEAIPLPPGYQLMVIDSGVRHDNTSGEFNQRVAAGRAGVGLLSGSHPGITHLRDVERVEWADLEALLPEVVTVSELKQQGIDLADIPGIKAHTPLKVRSRCRHVWSENRRVLEMVKLLKGELGADEIAQIGDLLAAAHASARIDYEISCPELNVLVDAAVEQDGVVGARLTGAGWGGCVLAMVEESAVDAFTRHIQERYSQESDYRATVFACQTTPGAGLVL